VGLWVLLAADTATLVALPGKTLPVILAGGVVLNDHVEHVDVVLAPECRCAPALNIDDAPARLVEDDLVPGVADVGDG